MSKIVRNYINAKWVESKSDKVLNMAEDAMKSSHIPFNPRTVTKEEVAQFYHKAM